MPGFAGGEWRNKGEDWHFHEREELLKKIWANWTRSLFLAGLDYSFLRSLHALKVILSKKAELTLAWYHLQPQLQLQQGSWPSCCLVGTEKSSENVHTRCLDRKETCSEREAQVSENWHGERVLNPVYFHLKPRALDSVNHDFKIEGKLNTGGSLWKGPRILWGCPWFLENTIPYKRTLQIERNQSFLLNICFLSF